MPRETIEGERSAEKLEQAHNEWVVKAKDHVLKGALWAVVQTKQWGGFLAMIEAGSQAYKGDFEKSLAYIGAIALAHGAGKAVWWGAKKFSSSKQREEFENAEDERTHRDTMRQYEKNPGRISQLVSRLTGSVNRENKDRGLDEKSLRAKMPEEERKELEDSDDYRMSEEMKNIYRENPERLKGILRRAADHIRWMEEDAKQQAEKSA